MRVRALAFVEFRKPAVSSAFSSAIRTTRNVCRQSVRQTRNSRRRTIFVIARRREHPLDGADSDEATQTGIGLCRLGCFVGAGARSQRRSRLLAMTISRCLRTSSQTLRHRVFDSWTRITNDPAPVIDVRPLLARLPGFRRRVEEVRRCRSVRNLDRHEAGIRSARVPAPLRRSARGRLALGNGSQHG